jgi:hypothetical protein
MKIENLLPELLDLVESTQVNEADEAKEFRSMIRFEPAGRGLLGDFAAIQAEGNGKATLKLIAGLLGLRPNKVIRIRSGLYGIYDVPNSQICFGQNENDLVEDQDEE